MSLIPQLTLFDISNKKCLLPKFLLPLIVTIILLKNVRERERESSYLTSSIIFSGFLSLLIAYCLLTKN